MDSQLFPAETYESFLSATVDYDHQLSPQHNFFRMLNEEGLDIQMPPTPTQSNSASPPTDVPEDDGSEKSTIVSVSTVFHPGTHATPPDLLLSSSDSVLFYVHIHTIRQAAPRAFSLDAPIKFTNGIVSIPEPSEVLNVILHMLYGTPCAVHSPTFDTLTTAVDCMPTHGIVPSAHIRPGTPLYALLLSHAPLVPLKLYTLAAHHSLEDLAVTTSSHLLTFSLASTSEEAAIRMGASYLRRLMLLHVHRFDALRRILLPPPLPHPATRKCTFEDQKKLTRAWALAAAYFSWDARSDLSTHSMQSALRPMMDHLECEMCLEGLNNRIKIVIVQWTAVERTI